MEEKSERVFHTPVLKEKVIEFLLQKDNGIIVDCTLGAGGHTSALLKAGFKGTIIGLDKDAEALKIAESVLSKFNNRVKMCNNDFKDIDEVLRNQKIEEGTVNGFLFDLGMSSMQVNESDRGFSYRKDGPLDMRMDKDGMTAEELVNETDIKVLEKIFKTYGEERLSRKIAFRIEEARKEKRITTTQELNRIILKSYGPRGRKLRRHPSAKVFQAIRIYINNEIEKLSSTFEKVCRYLNKGGRIVVISYHSLEDREFKKFVLNREDIVFVSKKVIKPTNKERNLNKRSRSAKLRAAECITEHNH